ncbi:MAG: hypothetical protein ABUK01_01925 [Leptospirales bacterium]
MALHIYKLDSTNPFLNLATEEYFLNQVNKLDENAYLFFYENSSSVILGKTLDLPKEVYSHKKLPFTIRRSSGGGSVAHFPGNLNYGILLSLEHYPELNNISNSYQIILQTLAKAIYPALAVQVAGISDLSIAQKGELKKISGNAQTRKRKWLLHHGTLIYDTTHLSQISYYLKPPPKEPDYRQSRKHNDFLLKKVPQQGKHRIIRSIIAAFSQKFDQTPACKKLIPEQKQEIRKYCTSFIQERRLSLK